MKRFVILALVGCILALVAADVFAWELKLKGVTEYRYRYLTRFGANDLFGDTGLAPVGINHIKQWTSRGTWNSGLDGNVGIYAGEPRFGADNNEVAMRATLYPTIIVNKAIYLVTIFENTFLFEPIFKIFERGNAFVQINY